MDLGVGARMPVGNGILTVDTEAQALGARPPGRAGQGRRGGAGSARAGAAQAPLGKPRGRMAMAAPRTAARPTGAARRGSPPCRRSIRWTSPATGSTISCAEFESHWLGREVEGEQYLPAEAAFFRDIVGGFVRRAAPARSADRPGARRRLAAQAHRGDLARGAARRRPTSSTSGATFRPASSCRNMSTSPMPSSTATRPAWSTPCSTQLARKLRAGEFAPATTDVDRIRTRGSEHAMAARRSARGPPRTG